MDSTSDNMETTQKQVQHISEENTHYGFTGKTVQIGDKTLHQIVATNDFGKVKKGDIGGFIEREDNLDFRSNAWVSAGDMILGRARVYDGVLVPDYTKMPTYGAGVDVNFDAGVLEFDKTPAKDRLRR